MGPGEFDLAGTYVRQVWQGKGVSRPQLSVSSQFIAKHELVLH